jgi:hypothetical protein
MAVLQAGGLSCVACRKLLSIFCLSVERLRMAVAVMA